MKRGRKKKNFKKSDILNAIKGSKGIVSVVADALGCAWETALNKINEHEDTRKAFEGESERSLDKIESKAYKQAEDGDGAMIRFILATKGRKRGYGETPPLPPADSEDTELRIVIDDSEQ